MITSYILVNRKVVAVESRFIWMLENPDWKAEENWLVANTQVDENTRISTVFLQSNVNEYGDENSPPVFFHTDICSHGNWGNERGYATWEEAEAGHNEVVKSLQNRDESDRS